MDWLTLAAFLGLGGLVVANWRFYSAPASTSGAATGGLAGVVAVATCIPCLAAVLGLLAVAGSFLVAVTVVKIAAFGLLVWSLYKFSRCDNCRVKK